MNEMIIFVSFASFKAQGDACPAVVEVNGVRLFSLSPRDSADAKRINAAIAYAATMTSK
jgi:hypothetical protein